MMSAILRQHASVARQYPDILVFFRLGDFYETYDNQAATVANVLGTTITMRGDVKVTGFPYFASESYIAKLLQAGHKVGIADMAGVK